MNRNKGYRAEPLSFNRRAVIASASVTSERNVIHTLTEIDVSEPRRLIKEYRIKTGEKLSFTAYIVSCLAETLKDHPDMNSFIKGRKLIRLDDITISVLLEKTIEGENVPEPIGIQQAGKKDYFQIHREIREAASRKIDQLGKLSENGWIRWIPAFLMKRFIRWADKNIRMARTYGKIAVTAVGMFGNDAAWFIPHGSATILITVGSIVERPVEQDGQYDSREHLCLTASFDHDIVDGAPAARFMKQFSETVRSGRLLAEPILSDKNARNEEKK